MIRCKAVPATSVHPGFQLFLLVAQMSGVTLKGLKDAKPKPRFRRNAFLITRDHCVGVRTNRRSVDCCWDAQLAKFRRKRAAAISHTPLFDTRHLGNPLATISKKEDQNDKSAY